jgi:TolA-binding protein
MKRFLPLLALYLLSTAGILRADDGQLAFADDLYASGDEVFALLEYRRFLFHNPNHAQAPAALLRLARLQITAGGNAEAARETALSLAGKYPQSPLATEAKAFSDFVEVNSDFGGQPLQLWLKAENLAGRQQSEQAVVLLRRLAESFPEARLADDALLRIATIQHESLGQTGAARETLALLAKAYPDSDLLVQAEYQAAKALAASEGQEAEAIQALRRFATRHPDHALAQEAMKQATALENQSLVLKRQFDVAFVRPYAVRREAKAEGTYHCDIEVGTGLSQREVQATLEEALVKEGAKRANPKDTVTIQAFFNFPLTKAGRGTWNPGNAPAYQIERREAKHLLLDFGLDILNQP